MASSLHEKLRERVTPEGQAFIKMSVSIVKRILELMAEKNFSKKQLAEKLGKSPSEISKWLSGMHNFTIKSLAKLENVLGASIINTEIVELTEKEKEILTQIRNKNSAGLTVVKGVAYKLNPINDEPALFVREEGEKYKKAKKKRT